MFSLTLAYFPPFQTILSEVPIRFYLLRDVNLNVCLKWWLTYDTEHPVIFVTSQASNVLRLHTLIFALGFSGASCIYLTSLVEFKLHDGNLSVCLKWWLIFDTDNPVVFVISQASNVLRLHTLVFAWVSRARLVFLSNFLLNSFWINCSLPVACFLSFQTFLSNVLSRFHLLRDVNLSVCLKWWLTFDTENPVIFVTSQASNVLRLHTLIFALGFSGTSCIYLTSLIEFKIHDGNLSVCLKWWLIFDTENPGIFVTSQASNVLRLHTLIFALGFFGRVLYLFDVPCWIQITWCLSKRMSEMMIDIWHWQSSGFRYITSFKCATPPPFGLCLSFFSSSCIPV